MAQSTCSVEGCDNEAKVKGWCKPHYMRQYRHGDLDVQRTVRQGETCSVEGCEKKPHGKGLCNTHFMRRRKHGSATANVRPRERQAGLICRGPECTRPAVTKGLCNSHEYQERVRGELTPLQGQKPKGVPCEIKDCGRPSLTDGLCRAHYDRRRRGDADWDRPVVSHAPHGEGHVNEDGYRVISVNGHTKLEHRHLVEQLLGRRLKRTESVHHLNGNRLDNRTDGPLHLVGKKYRSGNLEIWSTAQPAGQEIGHKIDFAVDLLRDYQPDLLAETQAARPIAERVAEARELLALYGELVPEAGPAGT